MARNSNVDPFSRTWSERLAESWKMLVLAALLIAELAVAAQTLTGESTIVEAQVIRFGSYATEVGDNPILIVRMNDGAVQQVLARQAGLTAFQACRVGGAVRLLKRGSLLTLAPGGCLGR